MAETREHKLVWKNFKKNVLDELNADLAVCIAVPDDYDYTNPYWQHSKYKWTTPEYENWMDAFDLAIKSDYPNVGDGWKKILNLPGNWISPLNGNSAGGALQIFFRWFLWKKLQEDNIFEKYDRVIFTRSDFMFLSPHPPMDLLSPDKIWIPNGEYYGGVTDRYAILSKANAEGYLTGIMKNIMTNTDAFYDKLKTLSKEYDLNYDPDTYSKPDKVVKVGLEVSVRAAIELEFPRDCLRFIPYIMYLVRSTDGKSRHNYGIWYEELGYYVKSPPEYHMAKTFETMFKTKADWYKMPRSEQPPYW